MAKYKNEFMNDDYADEMMKLWNDGHQEAIFAFGAECMNYYKKVHVQRPVTYALIAGGLAAVAVVAGKKVYRKLKEEKKPTEKPGRVWEA